MLYEYLNQCVSTFSLLIINKALCMRLNARTYQYSSDKNLRLLQAKTSSQAATPTKGVAGDEDAPVSPPPPPKITVDDVKKELALLGRPLRAATNIKAPLVNRLAARRGIKFRGCVASSASRTAPGAAAEVERGEPAGESGDAGIGAAAAASPAAAPTPTLTSAAGLGAGAGAGQKRKRQAGGMLAGLQAGQPETVADAADPATKIQRAADGAAVRGPPVTTVDRVSVGDWWSCSRDSSLGQAKRCFYWFYCPHNIAGMR